MEIRDYLRMLRRGWPVIALVTVLAFVLAGAYLALAPQRFEAKVVILVTTGTPTSTTDLEQGRQYAQSVSPTVADVIESRRILQPVSAELASPRSVAELQTMVTATARESTSLIDVTVAAGSADEAADIARAVSREAQDIVPSLLTRDENQVELQVVQEPLVPDAPVYPNPRRVLAIALIVGLVLGLAITIAFQALDTRLRRPEDVRVLSTVPLLGVIPRVKRSQRNHVIVRDDPGSAGVEAYRALRTNLVHLESTDRRSMLVTGVGHRDDVLVAVNLAWSMARAGRRVLLVDLDLRQSAVGDLLFVRDVPGVSELLAGGGELQDLVQETSEVGLDLLVSGSVRSSPSDLLSSPVVARVLRQAEGAYDAVVLHAPPLLVFTDAAVLSRVAGSTLVTVRARHARAVDLEDALVALRNVGVDPLGLVLVGASAHRGDLGRFRGGAQRPRAVTVDWDRPADVAQPSARRLQA